jgi:hypothetical protein
MTVIERYIEETESTESRNLYLFKPGIDVARLVHAALGLVSELSELSEAEHGENMKGVLDEVGDVAWYAALAVRAFPEDNRGRVLPRLVAVLTDPRAEVFPSLFLPGVAVSRLTSPVSEVADLAKKAMFANKWDEDRQLRLETALVQIVAACADLASRAGSDLSAVLTANLAKLKACHPAGFDANAKR